MYKILTWFNWLSGWKHGARKYVWRTKSSLWSKILRLRFGRVSKMKDRETPFRYSLFDASRKGEIQIGRMGVHHVQVDLVQKGRWHCE